MSGRTGGRRSARLLGRLAPVPVLLGVLAPPALALKPEIGYPATPGDFGIVCEWVTVQSPDSVRLVGWFYPAQDTAGIANHLVGRVMPVPKEMRPAARPYRPMPGGPRPTVVISGGDAGNMSFAILSAYRLCTRGFNVFTFDWRGFGESAPWRMPRDQLVCTEFLADFEAALALVKARPEVDPERIGLMGFSTGAYLSFAMLARHPELDALVARAIPSSFADLLPTIAPLDTTRHWYAPGDYPTELLPANATGRVTQAVLLIVGEKDVRTPPWMSEKVYRGLKGPRELWIVPGAGHGGMAAPEAVAPEEFWERATAFFSRHLVGKGGGR